jgi:predicted transcriptional regulator
MSTLTIELDEKLLSHLESRAAARGTTVTALVAQALEGLVRAGDREAKLGRFEWSTQPGAQATPFDGWDVELT